MREEKRQALSGSAWTILGYGLSQVLRLGSNLVLAYLLFPAAFGIMSLVAVFQQGLQMFSDVGIGPSIIQNPRGEDRAFLKTAFTIQAIRGVILWLASVLLAWPAARFFGQNDPLGHELLYVLPVVGLSALINGFASTSVFTLNRQMRFARITMLALIPHVVSMITMILWALVSPSVWALVSGMIANAIVRVALSHLFNRPARDSLGWDRSCGKELLHFGGWIFLSTAMAFFASSLDRLVLGKLLTLAELGLYSISLSFARLGVEVANRLSHTVLFPILSRNQANPGDLVRKSLKARSLILTAGGALISAFAIFAPVFFEQIYDPRYAGAGVISQWLAIYIWGLIILSSMERVPLALGHANALFASNLVVTIGYGVAAGGYVAGGLPGFILGLAFSVFAAHGLLLMWVPLGRARMLLQTAGFTAVFLAYVLSAIWLTRSLYGQYGKVADILFALVAAGIPCLLASVLVVLRIWSRKKMQ